MSRYHSVTYQIATARSTPSGSARVSTAAVSKLEARIVAVPIVRYLLVAARKPRLSAARRCKPAVDVYQDEDQEGDRAGHPHHTGRELLVGERADPAGPRRELRIVVIERAGSDGERDREHPADRHAGDRKHGAPRIG